MAVTDDLVRAREAFDRRDWVAAYDALLSADVTAMQPDDHARLATAAYLLGRRAESVRCFQTAFQAHLDRGETLAAVRTAFWLAMVLHANGEEAVGNGWVARSERLLADQPDDIVERGYLLIHAMYRFIFQPDHERAYELALEVTDFGRRFRDPDLLATGLAGQGRLLIYAGHVREGLALLDEAMVGVAAGELSPIMDGDIFCSLIEGCQEVSDFSRAAEWTEALSDWCDAQPGLVPFRGQCAVHRGQLHAGPRRLRPGGRGARDGRRPTTPSTDLSRRPVWPWASAATCCGSAGTWTRRRRRTRRRAGTATSRSPVSCCCGWRGTGPTRPSRRCAGCSSRGRTRSDVPRSSRPRWRCCWPRARRTRRPGWRTSSPGSPRTSGAPRCRRPRTTPVRRSGCTGATRGVPSPSCGRRRTPGGR